MADRPRRATPRGGPLRKSQVISVPIVRRYVEAYSVLKEPRNYPHWSPIAKAMFEPVGDDGLDWRVDLPRGRRILRFSAANDYGILDYNVLSEAGQPEYVARLRLVPNEEGAELIAVYFQRDGQTDEQFTSEVEWAANDLRAVAAVVERF
jgi:hypothetical protein